MELIITVLKNGVVSTYYPDYIIKILDIMAMSFISNKSKLFYL